MALCGLFWGRSKNSWWPEAQSLVRLLRELHSAMTPSWLLAHVSPRAFVFWEGSCSTLKGWHRKHRRDSKGAAVGSQECELGDEWP